MKMTEKFLTSNWCYKYANTGRTARMKPAGIVVHSTGVNQTKADVFYKRWNRGSSTVALHAVVGRVTDGSIGTYHLMPWDVQAWGCGSGNKGSYNASRIQFEICEDALTDKAYYTAVMQEAVKLCAYLCGLYKLPVESIVSHAEAHKLGYASNHADCDHWLKRFGNTMDDFRRWVKEAMGQEVSTEKPAEEKPTKPATEKATLAVGDVVNFTGTYHYRSADASIGYSCKPGTATVTRIYDGKHPYLLIKVQGGGSTVYGWVDAKDIETTTGGKPEETYGTHVVKWGDTLWGLAKKYLGAGSRYKEIQALNEMTGSWLKVGATLKIPKK